MSYHSKAVNPMLNPVRYQWLYALSVKVHRRGSSRSDALAGKILVQVAATVLCKRPCKPGLLALGRMHGRSPRSIQRAVAALVAAGYVEVIHRGKQLSNVLRLSQWLWCRLTGRLLGGQWRKAGPQLVSKIAEGILEAARRAHTAYRLARDAPQPA